MAREYLAGFSTEKEAIGKSEAEATARGCGQSLNDVTRYWWNIVKHPGKNEWALEFKKVNDKANLTLNEKSNVKSKGQMTGWF